jgi:hypothetical protein
MLIGNLYKEPSASASDRHVWEIDDVLDYSPASEPSPVEFGELIDGISVRAVLLADTGDPLTLAKDESEALPPPSPRKYWTRKGVAEWLVEKLAEHVPALVGIDHGFSFPLRYFEMHRLKPDWAAFLDDFQRHWPTDDDIYADFVRHGLRGNGAARTGSACW